MIEPLFHVIYRIIVTIINIFRAHDDRYLESIKKEQP